MTVFFSSDWHLGHQKPAIWSARGFPSMESHDNYLINDWKEKVGRFDEVVMVGDMLMGEHKVKRAVELFSMLPGKKIWCLGNHDPKPERLQPVMDLGVQVIPFGKSFEWGEQYGSFLLVQHLPYAGTPHAIHGAGDREHLPYPVDQGFPLVHGHTHSREFKSRGPANGLMFHVGVDAHGGLVRYEDILK